MDSKLMVIIALVLLSVLLYILLAPMLETPNTVVIDVNDSSIPECTSDLECGRPGFTGIYDCRGESIFGEYASFLCAGAGTQEAKCAKVTTLEFVANCVGDLDCIPGLKECQPKPTSTYPEAHTTLAPLPYRPSSGGVVTTTTLLYVNCVRNTNCGIDHYGKPYCSGAYSVRDYITYECVNPGTYSSRCVKEKTTYLLDYCGFDQACIDGECIELFEVKFPETACA